MSKLFTFPSIVPAKLNHFLPLQVQVPRPINPCPSHHLSPDPSTGTSAGPPRRGPPVSTRQSARVAMVAAYCTYSGALWRSAASQPEGKDIEYRFT